MRGWKRVPIDFDATPFLGKFTAFILCYKVRCWYRPQSVRISTPVNYAGLAAINLIAQ